MKTNIPDGRYFQAHANHSFPHDDRLYAVAPPTSMTGAMRSAREWKRCGYRVHIAPVVKEMTP